MKRREFLHAGASAWIAAPALLAAPLPSVQGGAPTAPAGGLGASNLSQTVAGLPADGVLATITPDPNVPVRTLPVLANDLVGLLYLQRPEPVFEALEQAIRRRLVALETARLGVFVPESVLATAVDEYVKDQIAAFHSKYGPGEDFAKYMQDVYGTTPAAYRAILADVVLENLLLERVVRYSASLAERIQFRLITTATLDAAKAIHEKLGEGANFAALAKAESIDENTKKNGGLLPPLPIDAEHSLVERAAKLAVGEVSEIGTETKAGRTIYWITKLEKRLPAETRPYAEIASALDSELAAGRVDLQEVVLWDLAVRKRYPIQVRLGR